MKLRIYDEWEKYGLTAGYTYDCDGHFATNDPNAMPNYERLSELTGISMDRMVRVRQFHTDEVLAASIEDGGEGVTKPVLEEYYDAVISNEDELMLCAVTADCTPVHLYDPVHKAIGMVHSGRAGTMKDITAKTLVNMHRLYGTMPEDTLCIIGPHLCQAHHEVNACDIKGFYDNFSGAEVDRFIKTRGDNCYVDMAAAIRLSLKKLGLREENILEDGRCTYEEPELYSWRRDHDKTKRVLSFIAMRKNI